MARWAPAARRPRHRQGPRLAGGAASGSASLPQGSKALSLVPAPHAGPASTLAAASQARGSFFLLIVQDPEGHSIHGLGWPPFVSGSGGRSGPGHRLRPAPRTTCGLTLAQPLPRPGRKRFMRPANEWASAAGKPAITARTKVRPRQQRGPGALKRGRSGGQASGQAGSSGRPPPPPGPQLPSGVATTSGYHQPAGLGGSGGSGRGRPGYAATPPRAEPQGKAPGAAHARSSGARSRPARPRTRTPRPARAHRRDPPPRRPRALTPPQRRARALTPSRARRPPSRPPPVRSPAPEARPPRPWPHAPGPRALPSPPRSRGRRAALLLLSPPSRMVAAAAAATQTLGSGGRAPRPEVTFQAASARAAPPSPQPPPAATPSWPL